MRAPRLCRLAAGALVLGAAGPALAGPDSEVPSAADPDDAVDLHLGLDYAYETEHATIVRERAGLPGTLASDPTPELDDLDSVHRRHVITPRASLGVYHDLWISLALPITISDRRELSYADGVDATSSTTLQDGLLTAAGFDADDPTTPLPAGDLLFRGPARGGIDQLHLGFGVAPMNQRRDDTKPTWKIGAEVRLAVGASAKFDPVNPAREDAIGSGVHELRAWTSMARRIGRFEPYMGLDWRAPLALKSDSAFADPGFGARRTGPQMHAGARGGFEFIAVERPADHVRVSADLGASLDAAFEGRAYTEMWEVFALAGAAGRGGPLELDGDPTTTGLQSLSHPGVTQVENSLRMDAHLGLRAELGPNLQIGAGMALGRTTGHVISFTDAGVDLPTCDGGTSGCESGGNELVTPGTAEVNPLYVNTIDLVGHRYRAEGIWTMQVLVSGTMLF